MEYIRNILLSLFVASTFIACNKDNMDAVGLESGALSDNEFEIPPTGGSFSIAYTSDRYWTITKIPTWINASVKEGKAGTTTIRFDARYNSFKVDRNSHIVISSNDGSFRDSVYVRQSYPYLKIENNEIDFMYNESEKNGTAPFEIPIVSNVKWIIKEVSDDETQDLSRFSLSSFNGENDYVLEVLPKNNNFGLEPNQAVFEIIPVMEDPDSGTGELIEIPKEVTEHYTIALSQDNFTFLLNGSPDELQVAFSELDNVSSVYDIAIQSEGAWTIKERPEWIRTNYESGQNITLSISPDGITPTVNERKGTIVLRVDAEEPVEREISVSQNGYVFSIDGEQNINIASDDTTKHTIMLKTTGNWEIQNIPDWLEVNPVSCEQTSLQTGITEHLITIKAKNENLEFEPLSANLIFTRIDKPYGIVDDPINIAKEVTHEAFVFELDPSPVLSGIPTYNTIAYPVNVKCTGDWEIESVPDWIDVSELSGKGGETTIMVNANSPNPDIDQDRTALIGFVSLKHKDAGLTVERDIEVKQRKYIFEIDAAELADIPAYKNTFPEYAANLTCSVEWTLLEYPDWLTPNVTSGDGMEDVEILFTPGYNQSSSSRSGIVRLKDKMENTINFTATQEAFVFDDSRVSFRDIPVMGGSYPLTFDMTAEAPWSLISYPDWIAPNATNGNAPSGGTVNISFVSEPNPNLEQRRGTAVLKSNIGGREKSIEFVQDELVFDDTPVDLHFTELSEEQERIRVECSGSWAIDGPDWAIFSPSTGTGSQTITVTVSENLDLQDRSYPFALYCTINTDLTKTINIEQDAFEFDSTPLRYEYTALEGRTERFDVLCSGRWAATNLPSWIHLSKNSGQGDESGDTEEVRLDVSNNLTESDRETVFRIKSTDNPALVKEITVWQERFIFVLSDTSCEFDAEDIGRVDIDVTCSGDWTVSCDEDWVNISNVTRYGFQISVDNNDSTSRRNSTIEVRNAESGITKAVYVTQNGAD